MKNLLLPLAAAGLLSACASLDQCDSKAPYRKATSIDPIHAADGLKLPESPAALKVPELTPAAQEAARQPLPMRGKHNACLDYPPAMAVTATEPAPAAATPPPTQ